MHQTTVRFGRDLWEALEKEAELAGVSVAQFIREAAVARLGYAAAARGDAEWSRAMADATDRTHGLHSVDEHTRTG